MLSGPVMGIAFVAGLSTAGNCPLFVDAGAPVGGDGLAWATAYRHLQDAIAAAAASGGSVTEIRVAEGTYRADESAAQPNGTGNRGATFTLLVDLALRGGYAGLGAPDPDARDVVLYPSVLSGDLQGNDGPGFTNMEDNTLNIVTAANLANAVLDGFTFSGGYGFNPGVGGAGLTCTGSTVHVLNCAFVASTGVLAAAVSVTQGSVDFQNCLFADNEVLYSGSAVRLTQADSCFTDCEFTGNHCTYNNSEGGAVYTSFGTAEFTRCTFVENSADEYGGAIDSRPGNLFLTDCVFLGNTVNRSGGPSSTLTAVARVRGRPRSSDACLPATPVVGTAALPSLAISTRSRSVAAGSSATRRRSISTRTPAEPGCTHQGASQG